MAGASWWQILPTERRFIRLTERDRAAQPMGVPAEWAGGSRGSSVGRCAHGRGGLLVAAAGSEFTAARFGLNTVDDRLCSDADHAFAGHPDGDDAAGAAHGGVSLFAPGAGYADRALKSDPAGAGADDDLVPDDAGADA